MREINIVGCRKRDENTDWRKRDTEREREREKGREIQRKADRR